MSQDKPVLTVEQIESARRLLRAAWYGFQEDSPVDALCDLALSASQGWISVEERLPEGNGDVLAAYEGGMRSVPEVNIRVLWNSREAGEECFYTHWMPCHPLPTTIMSRRRKR